MPPASQEPKVKCDYCSLEFAASKLQKRGPSLICSVCQTRLERISPAPEQPVHEFEYAGFLPRLGAFIIDLVLLWIVNLLLTSACSCLAPSPKEGLTRIMSLLLMLAFRFFLGAALGIGYYTYMVGAHEGTIGKIVMGLRII